MVQLLQGRSQVSGASSTVRSAAPRAAAAALRRRARAEALPRTSAEVHVWFAAPSPSSRYLDIVLAARGAPPVGA